LFFFFFFLFFFFSFFFFRLKTRKFRRSFQESLRSGGTSHSGYLHAIIVISTATVTTIL
ncbi:hypothetical protein QR685DRAFT_534544, partial [Neurospora intermedia]